MGRRRAPEVPRETSAGHAAAAGGGADRAVAGSAAGGGPQGAGAWAGGGADRAVAGSAAAGGRDGTGIDGGAGGVAVRAVAGSAAGGGADAAEAGGGDIEGALAAACADVAGLPAGALAAMAAHWRLLLVWNERVNLTRIVAPREAALLHYRDSLAALPYLSDGAGGVVDFGSGAGFPGLVLALARPQWPVTLVEPRRKRASFLQAAAARLGCRNVAVVVGRHDAPPPRLHAHAVTRATFAAAAERQQALRWLVPGGTLVAYRAAGAVAAGARAHPYEVDGRQRLLEIWEAAAPPP